MNKQQHILLKVFEKLQLFQGLTAEEVGRVIQVCKSKVIEASAHVYEVGAPSTSMLVLLQGRLLVQGRSGQTLGEVLPGSATGEMGVFTGHPRSASIVAAEKSLALTMDKADLQDFMGREVAIRAKVLTNVVRLLSDRLAEATKQIEALRAAKAQE